MNDRIEQVGGNRPRFSIRARLRSIVYAARGLRWLVQDEHNAQIHLLATAGVVACGFWLDASLSDWRWLSIAIALVWLSEAFNTAIEEICDRFCPEFDPAIGRIKDLSAGAVLLASFASLAIGLLTFAPLVLQRLAQNGIAIA